MKLSFVERLTIDERSSVKKDKTHSSVSKKLSLPMKDKPECLINFQEQHSDLKNILKFLEFPHNPQRSMKNAVKIQKKQSFNTPKFRKTLIDREQRKENICQQILIQPFQNKLIVLTKNDFVSYQKKKGIPNIGNTCYINAIIQCLFHLPKFNDYFLEQKYEEQVKNTKKNVVQIYRSLYISLMKACQPGSVSTLPLKKSVSKICSLFIDWAQEDAHEFMRSLLDSIHKDINRVSDKIMYKMLRKQSNNMALDKLASLYWEYYKQRDNSYIYDSLCGQLYNSVKCVNCGHQSENISIPMISGKRSLDELLANFFSQEKLSDYYSCQMCKKSNKKSIKTTLLWKAPKFLIIHLKRSQFGKKNVDPISFSTEFLNLKPYMQISNDKSSKYCQYFLNGVVMHQGGVQGGHYWCNVKQNGKWFNIDDELVLELDKTSVLNEFSKKGSSNAYILFYSSLHY